MSAKQKIQPAPLTHVPSELISQLRAAQTRPTSSKLEPLTSKNDESAANVADPNVPPKVKKPDSIWHFKRQRTKLKHLTNQPHSLTNSKKAGTKDISYLANCDDYNDKANIERIEKITDSILPQEYHIMKTKAVVGLEYQDEDFTTKLKEYPIEKQAELRLRSFPSLKPAKRNDAIQLLKILDEMLESAGLVSINDNDQNLITTPIDDPENFHLVSKGSKIDVSKDMAKIVGLIDKEQKIYNLVMHELIRQVTVECVERGELLAKLRDRYANLIGSIPAFIESIYNKALALQAMEKRLAHKLVNFKDRVETLASELSTVQQKEREASSETIRARRDLDDAVKEARRSADLLHEYQELYEMQRARLEKSVMLTTEERDIWTQIAYSLSLKVVDINNLISCKSVQANQTGWTQIARYFLATLLKDQDSRDFQTLSAKIEKMNLQARNLGNNIVNSESESLTNFINCLELFKKNLQILETTTILIENSNDGSGFELKTVHAPSDGGEKYFAGFTEKAKFYENVIENEIVKRSGEAFIKYTEELNNLEAQRQEIMHLASTIFHRHREAFAYSKGDSATDYSEKIQDLLNRKFKVITTWYSDRISGENGISKRLVMMQSAIETLLGKAKLTKLSDLEWLQFHVDLRNWIKTLSDIVSILESSLSRDQRIESIQHWENLDYVQQKLEQEKLEKEAALQNKSESTAALENLNIIDEGPVKKTAEMIDQEVLEKENDVNSVEMGLFGYVANLSDWLEQSNTATTTNNKSLCDRVDSMNNELMKWLSNYLIECAPQMQSGRPELEPGCEEATKVYVSTGLARRSGMSDLLSKANLIALSMNDLTEGIRHAVKPILNELVATSQQSTAQRNDAHLQETLKDDMKKIATFIDHCDDWSVIVGNLMSNCFGMKIDLRDSHEHIVEILGEDAEIEDNNNPIIQFQKNILGLDYNDSQQLLGGKGNRNYENADEKMYAELVDRTNAIQAISFDGNVHTLQLKKIKESKEQVSTPMSEYTQSNFEALNTVRELQKQLEESEGLIYKTEQRCSNLLG